jgi:hypothetical protein
MTEPKIRLYCPICGTDNMLELFKSRSCINCGTNLNLQPNEFSAYPEKDFTLFFEVSK